MSFCQVAQFAALTFFVSSWASADCLKDYGPGYGDLVARCDSISPADSSAEPVGKVDLCIKHRISSTADGELDVYTIAGTLENGSGTVRVFTAGSRASFITKWNTPWAELINGVLTIEDRSGILSGGRLTSSLNFNAEPAVLQFDFKDPNSGQYSFRASCSTK